MFLMPVFLVYGFYKKDSYGIDQFQRYIVINEEVGLDGQHIQQAQVIADQITGRPNVVFNLDNEGGELFYKLTSDNTNKTLSVVMDNKVKAAARITEPIRDAVRITGFASDEANDLALTLRTAALPVDLEIINQNAVGASLGSDAIGAGLRAIMLGFIGVVVFMLIYYKGAGLIADIALVLNLIFIIAILSSFNMTLTMTSIASLILTVGMAVDANVIIFERIKEELRLGKSRARRNRSRIQKSFLDGYGRQHHNIYCCNFPFTARKGYHPGIRSNPGRGYRLLAVYGDLRIPSDIRFRYGSSRERKNQHLLGA